MKNINIYLLIAITAAFLCSSSCSKVSSPEPVFQEKEKTILVYMASNNNLQPDAVRNIKKILAGDIPQNGNIALYCNNFNLESGNVRQKGMLLVNLTKDHKGNVIKDTLYRFGENRNSATKEALQSALNVTKTMLPARQYGVILWSHGTGWLPEGYYSNPTKSFAEEYGTEMSIPDLAKAFSYKVDFIAFDACLMGGIEIAYQLRDICNYLIFSPAEMMAEGFPYSKIMPYLFAADYDGAAKCIYDLYDSKSGENRSVTISVVKTSELEAVAANAKEIFEKYRNEISSIDPSTIQGYFRSNKHWFYDLQDLIDRIAQPSESATFSVLLSKAVVSKYTTGRLLGLIIDPNRFSGISTYINSPANATLSSYYKGFEWNRATLFIQ